MQRYQICDLQAFFGVLRKCLLRKELSSLIIEINNFISYQIIFFFSESDLACTPLVVEFSIQKRIAFPNIMLRCFIDNLTLHHDYFFLLVKEIFTDHPHQPTGNSAYLYQQQQRPILQFGTLEITREELVYHKCDLIMSPV